VVFHDRVGVLAGWSCWDGIGKEWIEMARDRIDNMGTSDVWVFGRAPKICCGFDSDEDTRMFVGITGRSVEMRCIELRDMVKEGTAYPAIPIPVDMVLRIHAALLSADPALDDELKAIARDW